MADFATWKNSNLVRFAIDAHARMKAQDALIIALRQNLFDVVQLLKAEEDFARTVEPDESEGQ